MSARAKTAPGDSRGEIEYALRNCGLTQTQLGKVCDALRGEHRSSGPTHRAARAAESFRSAAEAIGDVHPGLAVFLISRGQYSMIDVIEYLAAKAAPASLTVWTWSLAEYDLVRVIALADAGIVDDATIVIDHAVRSKGLEMVSAWRARFGPSSVRYVVNHSKMATIEGRGLRLAIRGSMNLDHSPRFEQLDISEGCPAFDLIRSIEDGLPVLADDAPGRDIYDAAKVSPTFGKGRLGMFAGAGKWVPK